MSRDHSFDPTLYMPRRDIGLDRIVEAASELARELPEFETLLKRSQEERRELAASRGRTRDAQRASRSNRRPRRPRPVKLSRAALGVCTRWIRNSLLFVERIGALRWDKRAERPGDDAESWERELRAVIGGVADALSAAPPRLAESLALIREATATRGELRTCLGMSGPSAHENVHLWLQSVSDAWDRSYWVEDRLTDAELAMRRADHGRWFIRCFHAASRSELDEVAGFLRMEQAMASDRLEQTRPKVKRTSGNADETFRARVTRAESIVRGSNDVFPGTNELSRRLECGKSTLARIMAESAYLQQCREATGKRRAKPKELSFEPGVLDVLSEERARSAELRECIADQERDAKKDRINLAKARPSKERGDRSAARSGTVR